jgi:hypothetical protein
MVVVIFIQFLQEMRGFVTCGDVSENAGVFICCRSGIATDAHTAVSFFPCNLGRVRVLSVA